MARPLPRRMTDRNARRLMRKAAEKRARTRECGDCTACCSALGVPELVKPSGTPCLHQKSASGAPGAPGCAIYATRPQSCRDYACLWRQGVGQEDQRPDRLGVVLETNQEAAYGKPMLIARETFPGGFKQAEAALHALAARQVIILVDGSTRSLMGPEEEVNAALEFAAEYQRRRLHVLPEID